MAARREEIDWQGVFAGRVRAIEDLYADTHQELLEWGRWGRDRFPGRPRLMLSGIWTLPGETDPDRDPEAAPVNRPAKIDERMVIALDASINAPDFPAIWQKVLVVNYIPPKFCMHIIPEYQRPNAARMGSENFIEQLSNVLDFLRG